MQKSHFQCNANREVATTSLRFCNLSNSATGIQFSQ